MNEDKLYPVDYSVFVMSRQEKNKFIIIAAAALFLTGYIFFQSLIISGIFSMGSFLYPAYKARELMEKRKRALIVQFKDALYSLSSSLGVGKSLESSFKYALNDLRVLYPDEDTYILKEFELICRKIEMNVPVEKALEDLSKRSGLEDINSFTEVIAICKRTGGNLVEVV
ncbi:MAG: type II secretion system F family protein, partial [Desulfocucumaceae bacterium]